MGECLGFVRDVCEGLRLVDVVSEHLEHGGVLSEGLGLVDFVNEGLGLIGVVTLIYQQLSMRAINNTGLKSHIKCVLCKIYRFSQKI